MKKHTITKLLVLLLVLAMTLPCLPVIVSAADGEATFAEQMEAYHTTTEFVINTKADLKTFMTSGKNFAGKTVKLGADIVWNEGTVDFVNGAFVPADGTEIEYWTPVATTFGGDTAVVFDGQGHRISGIVIESADATNVGFFKSIKNATIKNVIFDNAYLNSTDTFAKQLGFIAGVTYGSSTFKNVHVDAYQNYATTANPSYIGGFCGYLFSGNSLTSFEGCTLNGVLNATGAQRVGGFVGSAQYFSAGSSFTDCVNYATINGKAYTAGILGRVNGNATFTRCTSIGKVTAATASLSATMTTFANNSATNIPVVTFSNCYHSTVSNTYAATIYYNKDTKYTYVKIKVDDNAEVNYSDTTLASTTSIGDDITAKFKTYIKGATGAVTVYGVQQSADKSKARFITTLKTNSNQNEKNIASISFEISPLGGNAIAKACPAVYKSILATTESGTIKNIKVGEGEFKNVDYLATGVVEGLPTSADSVMTLVVTTFITTNNGTRVNSNKGSLVLTISGGNIVGIAHTA